MRILGRLLGFVIILFIIPSTACAFWLYNANRVVLDKGTYSTVLQGGYLFQDYLVAVLEGFTYEMAIPRDAAAILPRFGPDAWGPITDAVLAAPAAKQSVNSLIDTMFDWLDFKVGTLDTLINLSGIKEKLTSTSLRPAITASVGRMLPCTSAQTTQIAAFNAQMSSFQDLPICQPADTNARATVEAGIASAFAAIAVTLPDRWSLDQDFHTQIMPASPLPSNPPGNAQRFNTLQMEQVRAGLRLQSRLLLLLFLIPVALLCVIVIVAIRSLKAFLRWTGWILIVSGLISLLPVFLLPALHSGFVDARFSFEEGLGTGGQALTVFLAAMLQAIVSELTLTVLFQVAALVVVGLVVVFVSVALPQGDALTEDDLARLETAALGG